MKIIIICLMDCLFKLLSEGETESDHRSENDDFDDVKHSNVINHLYMTTLIEKQS